MLLHNTVLHFIMFLMSIMSMRNIPFSGGDFMRFIGRAFELRELEEEYEKGIFA